MTRKSKTPRKASTYRGARRNQVLRVLRSVWAGIKPTRRIQLPPVRANRSRHWPNANFEPRVVVA